MHETLKAECDRPPEREETADGVWDLYVFDRLLARLDERDLKLRS